MAIGITKAEPYLNLLAQRVVVFDGAMGTSLEAQGLTPAHYGGSALAGCNDHLNLAYPQAVERVHRSFLEAGVDVIETNTFRANRFTLGEFGLAGKIAEINLAGARIARAAADSFSTSARPRLVAGSMGPSGMLLSLEHAQCDFEALSDAFCEQATALLEGGVDLLLLETQQDILEVKAAIFGIRRAFAALGRAVPIQAQVTLDASGRMLAGTDAAAVAAILDGMGIDVLGINCSTGPEAMRGALASLSRAAHLPLACLPNAGMPEQVDGKAVYPLAPNDFAAIMDSYAQEFGLNVLGGCCGTTPDHLRLLVERINSRKPAARPAAPRASLASAFQPVPMRQSPAPFIIGERLNTQGSRHFKQLMLRDDFDAAVALGRAQAESGAHALDVCTALTEDGREAERMAELAARLSARVDAPLVIDSTDPAVMDAALKRAPGRCLLNSINLEGGEARARAVLALASAHNATVIALTIDERGMAQTAETKLAVAKRIRALAVEKFGLAEASLVFDPLTFTLATGSPETADAARQTLEGIRLIKAAMPAAHVLLGVSNVSFGLKPAARQALNSIFLYHAVQAGLDMAILNPAQLCPYADIALKVRQSAEALIFNRQPDALAEFVACFSDDSAAQKTASPSAFASLPHEDRVRQRVLLRQREGLEKDMDDFIHTGNDAHARALDLLNGILLPAMQAVGDAFAKGELILPYVLQSAEVMRAATDHLEPFLAGAGSARKGKLVLATVYGDVHDIGKNLVKSILSNNGYAVVDLGKQVPVDAIVTHAQEEQADAIGLSALLVSTSQQMPQVAAELQRRGMTIPLLIGGAAINPAFAERAARLPDGSAYRGGVFYCKDAFDALKVLDNQAAASKPAETAQASQPPAYAPETGEFARCALPVPAPSPPFWGSRLVQNIPLDDLFAYLNRSALFRISWGAANARGEKWEKYHAEFEQRLAAMRAELQSEPWLTASALYGFFRCRGEGNDLIILDEKLSASEHFHLPRQSFGGRLCLADYFASPDNDPGLAIFQIVTLGSHAVAHVQAMQKQGGIAEAFYHHGLAVQLTEAAANWAHQRIRAELGLGARQGKRYSWGYPAIPDLSQHAALFRLLPAEAQLGLHLTSAYQFVPEYTTAALVAHHPQAAYFRMDA